MPQLRLMLASACLAAFAASLLSHLCTSRLSGAGTPVRQNGRADRYGDPLPEGAIARLGTTRFRQDDWMSATVLSPDCKVLATSSSRPRSLRLWDIETGKPLPLERNAQRLNRLFKFSHDGKQLAAMYSGEKGPPVLSVLDVASDAVRLVPGDTRSCIRAMFSPDDKLFAWSDDRVHVLDAVTLQDVPKIVRGNSDVVSIAFSPEGDFLAVSTEDKIIRFWSLKNREAVAELSGNDEEAHALVFSPDGKTLACVSNDQTIRVWDVAARKPLYVLGKQTVDSRGATRLPVGIPAFSRDSKLLTNGGALWEVATGKELRRWQAGGCFPVGFLPDAKTLVTLWRYEAAPRFWNVTTGEESRKFGGHHANISWLLFERDGKGLISGDDRQEILRWELDAGRDRAMARVPPKAFVRSALSPDGKVLATWEVHRADCGVRLLDSATGKELHLLGRHHWISPSGRAMAPGRAFAFTPDAKSVAWIDQLRVVLNDVSSGREIREFRVPEGELYCLTFSPDGRLLAAGNLGTAKRSIVLWETATGKEHRSLGNGEPVEDLRFSPDGALLVSIAGGAPARLWDVASGKKRYDFAGSEGGAYAVNFSASGRMVALASSDAKQGVGVWETSTNQRANHFACEATPTCVAFAPDGRTLAAGYADTTILLWDLVPQFRERKSP